MSTQIVSYGSSFQGGSWPTAGSMSIDTTGADALIAIVYNNSTWAGGIPDVTYGGVPMTLVGEYANEVTPGFGHLSAYQMSNPTQGVANLAYSQATGNYNPERLLFYVALSGAADTDVLAAFTGFSRPRAEGGAMSWPHTIEGLSAGDYIIDATYGYWLTSTPTADKGTVLAELTTNNAVKFRAVGMSATAATETITWTIDPFNDATALVLVVAGAGGGGDPVEPEEGVPSVIRIQDGAGGTKVAIIRFKAA